MKKGRHRRFEEARKLKQSGPEAFGGIRSPRVRQPHSHRRRRRIRRSRREVRRHVRRRRRGRRRPLGPGRSPPCGLDSHREPVPRSATLPWSRTSTMGRPPSSTRSCAPPGCSARTSTWSSGSWTPTTRSASGASRSWPRPPRSSGVACASTSSTPRATPTSAARSSGRWPWSTACCCWSTRPRVRCPRPGTCCPKALALELPAVVVINKVDRGDARPDEVLDEIEQLFIDLATDADHLDFRDRVGGRPARAAPMAGVAMPASDADVTRAARHHAGDGARLRPATATLPLQALVTNLDASDYLGRLAIGRVVQRRPASGRDRGAARGGVRRGPASAAAAPDPADGLPRHRPRARSTSWRRVTCSSSPGSPRSRSATPSPRPTRRWPLPRLDVDEPVLTHDASA